MARLYIAQIIQLLFYCYTTLIFVRILISWFPDWQRYSWVRFISFLTDPYLNVFRRVIPPLGGVMDISPILAFFALRIAERIILQFIL